jgi:bacterial/archaeal transporter family-2 protein
METTFAILSIIAGALLAVQAGANAQLANAVGSPFSATAIQLALGAVVLAIFAMLTGQLGALAKLGDVPAWHALGGIASALYVVATILLYPRIGAVLAVGLIIAGQMLASLILDLTGLFGVTQRLPGPGMLAGAAAVFAGAAAIAMGGAGASGGARAPAWLALGLVAGAVLPVQGAVNGLLKLDLGAPFAVATVSFVVATIAMLPVLLFLRMRAGNGEGGGPGIVALPWWGWLGALCGATYVTTVFTALPVIGAAATVGLTVLGQQAASLLVDQYGLLRLPRRAISGLRLAGIILLMAGVLALRLS